MSTDPDAITTNETLIDDPELHLAYGSLYAQEFWGISRHELVAGAAQSFLSAAAQQAVARILEPLDQTSLREIAGWADLVKDWEDGPPFNDAATREFFQDERNKSNGTWHYVNLPVDAAGYDPEQYATFTRDDDVVQMTLTSVQVLQGDSDRFSEANALRLVAHLVGDLHQPLHVGCGFVEQSNGSATLVRDPAVAAAHNLPHDRGGNLVFLPIGSNGKNLHSYWDSQLGGGGQGAVADQASPMTATPALRDRFIAKLRAMIQRSQVTGALAGELALDSPDALVVDWTNGALRGARSAYQTLAITGPRQSGNGYDLSWEGRDAYDARCAPIVAEQLTRAGHNLATLLNAVWP